VIAVRAEPPRIMPDEVAVIDALVAHEGAPVSIEQAQQVSAPTAPLELQNMIAFDGSAWTIRAPSDIGAPRFDAPVPVDLLLVFAGELYVKKTVWLGEQAANPATPAFTVDGILAEGELAIPLGRDVYFEVVGDGDPQKTEPLRVNWLTSCGTLFQDDVARAFLRADENCDGELVVVVRDSLGGVSWRATRFIAR
jgi:hypothetical protein